MIVDQPSGVVRSDDDRRLRKPLGPLVAPELEHRAPRTPARSFERIGIARVGVLVSRAAPRFEEEASRSENSSRRSPHGKILDVRTYW